MSAAALVENLAMWHRPTIAQVRNAVLDGRFITPSLDDSDAALLAKMAGTFEHAVRGGRLFNMGHIQNRLLTSEYRRAADLFVAGHTGHPFREAYAFYHTWDTGHIVGGASRWHGDCGSLYVVDPWDMHAYSGGRIPAGTFTVCEAQAVTVAGAPALMICAMTSGAVVRDPASATTAYQAYVVRHAVRDECSESAIVGSLLDPVMACLAMLATDGIEVTAVEAPEKLNRQREKAARPPIPSHYDVKTGPYVTALNDRTGRRSEPKGGRHASPVPHLRRGHLRHLPGGATTWVRDAVINLKDPAAPLARSFYQRRQEAAS